MTTRILVANASCAYLYTAKHLCTDIQLTKELKHPESREKNIDLTSDIPGTSCRPTQFSTNTHARSAYEKSHPKKVEAERFAIILAEELNSGCNKNCYDRVIIVAPPKFYGLLKKHFHNYHPNLKVEHLAKDYTQITLEELTNHLREAFI